MGRCDGQVALAQGPVGRGASGQGRLRGLLEARITRSVRLPLGDETHLLVDADVGVDRILTARYFLAIVALPHL